MGFADTRIRSLETARECVRLGARPRTIEWITGLPPSFILRSVFDKTHRAPRGRPPYTEEFIFRASLKVQAEISIFALRYRQLKADGFSPAQSLLTAYRHHLTVIKTASFCFDEAFFLVSNLDGIWARRSPAIDLCECLRCGCTHIVPMGSKAKSGCPFCRAHVVAPHSGHHRADALPSATPAGAPSLEPCAKLDERIQALRAHRQFERLGAHPRIVAALTSGTRGADRLSSPDSASPRPRCGHPLSLKRWGVSVKTVARIRYSILAVAYRRLLESGFEPVEALRSAFVHTASLFPANAWLSFDRCFEVISLMDARWGVAHSELDLIPCPKCGSHHLVSRQDLTAAGCPFCALIRQPRLCM